MTASIPIDVPDALIASQLRHGGAHGRAWIASLPRADPERPGPLGFAARRASPARHCIVGAASGVRGRHGRRAQAPSARREPIGLRAWDGAGAVRLLDHDPATGAMLLERLDATRPLSAVADGPALQILAELLARLVAVPTPHGLRRLADIAAAMLDQVPRAVPCCATRPSSGWCGSARLPSRS